MFSTKFPTFLGNLVIVSVLLFLLPKVNSAKLKLCLVDGKGENKRSARYCPKLDEPDSRVECVVALDRLDCLRRIHKGKADFGVFTPEDLVAAANSEVDISITDELRYFQDQNFEYEVVAVVSDRAGIRKKHDLRDKRYCHPGYGYEADWSRILSNFFEASVVTPQCDPRLTITENRVKASSEFFGAACKAGPWVNDPLLDIQLKKKYPNLCSLCGEPATCSNQDQYWGRRGSLLCLTDGAGQISWARLEDVRQHFGLIPGNKEASPDGYSFLCPDDTLIPLNSNRTCVWVVKPWSVIASKKSMAPQVRNVLDMAVDVNHTSWTWNLFNLIEPMYFAAQPLDPMLSIQQFFERATGFLSANSFSACHPPRTIRICTTSNIETAKCSWLRESAAVYGIEPDLDCLKADNTTHCMMALIDNAADVVMVPPDLVHKAKREYKLKTLFYETVSDNNKYLTVPVVRKGTKIRSLEDMRGSKACFPTYDGVAWNSVVHALQRKGLMGCSINIEMAHFFGPSCVPNIPKNESEMLWKSCQNDGFEGDMAALHCLTSGTGDVAFLSTNFISRLSNSNNFEYPEFRQAAVTLETVCPGNDLKQCHLSWAPAGQAMVRSTSSDLWMKDTLDVFLQLDGLFGKQYKDQTRAFTLFGRYDGASDVLFHDFTEKLRDVPTWKNWDHMDLVYDKILDDVKICYSSSSRRYQPIAATLAIPVLFIAVLSSIY